MNEALNRLNRDDPADRVPTGIMALERQTGGLHRRQTNYLAGRPSMGKSTMASVIAVHAARAGHGVLYVSLEMTLEQLAARIASAATFVPGSKPIPYDRALNRQLSDDERERFIRAGLGWASLPIAIEERPGLSTAEIAARVRKTAQEFAGKGQRLGLVIIDLLTKVRPRDLRAPLVQQLGQISNDLTSLAKSENVALLVLHQLNRGVEGRDNKRPNMSDLRDSGNLEQDADGVWLLYRPAYYLARGEDGETPEQAISRNLDLEKKKHILEIHIAKNRNGAVGTIEAFCDLAFNVITDIDRRSA
jgi:replicative DNA helicase